MPPLEGDKLDDFKQLQPGDPEVGEATVLIGMPMRMVSKKTGKPLNRIPDDSPLYSEVSIQIGTPGPGQGRPQVIVKPEPPAIQSQLVDLTGIPRIPQFRDRLPDEDRREWFAARSKFEHDLLDREWIRPSAGEEGGSQ